MTKPEMSNETKAVILAAGKGTRMKSSIPKVLHEIFDKTLIERVIDSVNGIDSLTETFVIVGHQSKKVTEKLQQKYDEKIAIKTVLQDPQLGTGDAVFKVHDFLKEYKGTLLIACGDTPLLTTDTLQDFVLAHKNSNSALTVMSAIVDEPINYGRIVRDGQKNLKKIVEQKDANDEEKTIKEINAGVYCIEWEKIAPAFFDLTTNNEQGEYYLTDIVDWAVKKSLKTQAYVLDDIDEVFGINSREHLALATKKMNQQKIKQLQDNGVTVVDPDNTWISPETKIDEDSIIYPGCYISGINSFGKFNELGPNTFIQGDVKTEESVQISYSKVSKANFSSNVTVGPFAHIRDGVEIDSNARIGNFVEVKKSNIKQNTNVAHLSYIGDSELGENVNIGAGTITANYDPLSKQKSKTILKDGVKVGSNSVLVAPVTINENANIGAGSVITKDIPSNALAITRGVQKIIENWVTKRLKQIQKK